MDIVYCATHGFAARMLTQTDLLGKLVERGLSVGLIAPDATDANLKEYCIPRGIELVSFEPEENKWRDEYFRARKYFLDDVSGNPNLKERHLRAIQSEGNSFWKRLRFYTYYQIYLARKNWFPSIKKWYVKKEEQLLKNEQAQRLMDELSPKVFVSTYPVNYKEGMLLHAAKLAGCTNYIHLLSWDNIVTKGTFFGEADKYLLWGKVMAEELKSYTQVDSENLEIVGVPHFDFHIQLKDRLKSVEVLKGLGLNPQKPFLFFGMSASHFAPKEIDIVEWIADRITEGEFGADMQLVVRPHPQNISGSMSDHSWLPRLKALDGRENTVVFYPGMVKSKMPWSMQQSDMEQLIHLIASSALVFNSGSTITIDAMMCDRPVIITSFDADEQLDYHKSARRLLDYIHLKKITADSGLDVARSFEDLMNHTKAYLENPNLKLKARRKTIKRYCDNYAQGDATIRVVDHLAEAIGMTAASTTLH
ncbi:MAG: hypothetical protein AAGF87_09555 [Bacteroidota bacterium]